MGNTWEVNKWAQYGEGWGTMTGKWHDELVYGGESFLKAVWYFYKTKRSGVGCVKLEWRK